jgi:hypothetical protein
MAVRKALVMTTSLMKVFSSLGNRFPDSTADLFSEGHVFRQGARCDG